MNKEIDHLVLDEYVAQPAYNFDDLPLGLGAINDETAENDSLVEFLTFLVKLKPIKGSL